MADDIKVDLSQDPPKEDKGITSIIPDLGVTKESTPEQPVKEVEDSQVIFVPFKDFEGRINQTDFNFREGIPTKVPKAQANVWIESKQGYLK